MTPSQSLTKKSAFRQAALRRAMYLAGFVACFLLAAMLPILFGVQVHPAWWLLTLAMPVSAGVAMAYAATCFVEIIYGLPRREALNYWTLSAWGPAAPLRDYPSLIITHGQVEKKGPSSTLQRMGGPGLLVVSNDSAVVLECAGRLTRALGPCVEFLRPFECVHEMIDLRPQVREMNHVRAITQDGLPIEVDAKVTFQISVAPRPVSDQAPYTPALPAVKRAALSQTNVNQERVANWADRMTGALDTTLREIIAGYDLDALVTSDGAAATARTTIQAELHARLSASASNLGARLLDVQLSAFRLSHDDSNRKVQAQRVESWKAGREGAATAKRALGEAWALELYQQAEREVRQQMIADLIQCLQPSGEDLSDLLVAMRLVETLEKMSSSPESGIFLPRETAETLDKLRSMLAAHMTRAPGVLVAGRNAR